jgi:hypothetical protein
MPAKLKPFEVAGHYQATYQMGSGETGKARADLLRAQADRFNLPVTKLIALAVQLLSLTVDTSAELQAAKGNIK